MTEFVAALRELNEAAYKVVRASGHLPETERAPLKRIARESDLLVDNGGKLPYVRKGR